jgi:hypothetical protein
MDEFARWIGYTVMVGGALMIMCGFIWLVVEIVWRLFRNLWSVKYVIEATAEWRKNHPEKFKNWKTRNGISDGF